MAEHLFRWVGCTDRRRPHDARRARGVKLRMAQLTDPHMPSDISLSRRLRDLARVHRSAAQLSHDISAISNELSQPYRRRRKEYTNLIKKALMGLHQLDVDHLIITGDLAHCGLSAEFLEIKAALMMTGWWGDKLTVIPGNHDRFNLYDAIVDEPMEVFFDVVHARAPRLKLLPEGVVLVELDTNSDPVEDPRRADRWFPNATGVIYPEAVDAVDRVHAQYAGRRALVLVHHHVTDDWYPKNTIQRLGFLDPLEGTDDLLCVTDLIDPHALILHGHIHHVMGLDYTYNDHHVLCPGGFAEHLRINLIDMDTHDEMVVTQLELRA